MTTSTYACRCDNKGRSFVEIQEHLRKVHKINTKTAPFTQKALVFLDGEGWSQQEFEMTNGDLIIHKTVLIEADKKKGKR